MRDNLLRAARNANRGKKKKTRWKKAMAVLACGVVFCTMYALILPAITMEKEESSVSTEEYGEYGEKILEDGSVDQTEKTGSVRQTDGTEQKETVAASSAQKTDTASNAGGTSEQEETEVADATDRTEGAQEEIQTDEGISGEAKADTEKKHRMTYEGKDYTVKVAFSDKAGIPEDAKLEVKELKQDSEAYKEHLEKAEEALPEDQGVLFCRFFDVSFVKGETEIEPDDSVDIQVSYAEDDTLPVKEGVTGNAIHFADDGIEILPASIEQNEKGEDTFAFTQDSFSVVGTAITTIRITDGSYIFYTGEYALGVKNQRLVPIEITIKENGYIYPKNSSDSIRDITWSCNVRYNGISGSWRNQASNLYLNLQGQTPTVSGNPEIVDARVINNAIRLSTTTTTNMGTVASYYLGFDTEKRIYTVGNKFADGRYFLGARVETVSEEVTTPGALVIDDQIKTEGVLKPRVNTSELDGKQVTYTWYRRDSSEDAWKEVTRRRVTGESYNVEENGSWLNVALDGGADKEYMVQITGLNGYPISQEIKSEAYRVPYYAQIQNGNFEEPKISTDVTDTEHYQPLLPNGTAGMVWKTTAADQKVEYVSVASPEFQNMSYKWHNCDAAAKGVQYVELNAGMEGALYQDVLTIPGSTMYWSLAHRGRGPENMKNSTQTTDTMYVVVMSTELAEKYNITSQDAVKKVIRMPSAYPGARVEEITDDNRRWYYHSGEYEVPESQYLTRYFFVAGETAFDRLRPGSSIQYTVGNHLDDIYFSTELPPPAAGKVNLEVSKTIRGLEEEDARNLLNQMKFSIDGETISGNEFKNFTVNEDGTCTATYQIQIEIGNASYITKRVDEMLSTAQVNGYRLAKTTVSVNGGKTSEDNRASITIKDQNRGSVAFENTYEQETVSMRIQKVDEKNQALEGVKFSLEENADGAWKTIEKELEVNSKGSIELSGMKMDTCYRLTEIKTPDGYQPLTEPVYFKIIKKNGEAQLIPCNETGEEITDWPDHVKVLAYTPTELKIINEKGARLPDTGGMGTGGIYAMGILMTFSTMVLCGYRKRKS